VRHFDGAVANRVGAFERANNLASAVGLDFEIAIGGFSNSLRENLGSAVNCVERLRETRRAAPCDLRHCLCNGRSGQGCCGCSACTGYPSLFDKGTTIHKNLPVEVTPRGKGFSYQLHPSDMG
jgi:hypothetical protein